MRTLSAILAILFAFTQVAFATTTSTSSYSHVDAPWLNLSATLKENGNVDLLWHPSEIENFRGWKVVRSEENSSPVYPEDGYILFDTNATTDSYTDTNPPSGTVYYRICAITTDKVRYCSDTETIENTGEYTAYEPIVLNQDLDLQVAPKEGTDDLLITWEPIEFENFEYWKVLRSQTETALSFPENDVYLYTGFITDEDITDPSPLPGTTYYRLCAITTTKERYCSLTVAYDSETQTSTTLSAEESTLSDPEDSSELEEEGDDDEIACTTEYEPVCGEDGETYSNSCFATEIHKVEIAYEGECESSETCSLEDEEDCETITADFTLNSSYDPSNQTVDLSWEPAPQENIKYYKISRSQENPHPTYPEDGYIAILDPSEQNPEDGLYSTTDQPTETETYYYAITAVTDTEDGEIYTYSNAVTIEFTAPSFPDTEEHAYSKAISYVKQQGIVSGYPDGSYKPDREINRAEFSKILSEAKYQNIPEESNCFEDVQEEWYSKYICLLKQEEIIAGYPDGFFRPEREINIVEALKIILLTYEVDLPEISGHWYASYWKYALENNLLPPTITSVDKKITRAEMAEIIYRLNLNE